MTEQFIAGIVGAPFGLKGFVKIKPLSGEIDHLLKLTSVTLRRDGKDQSFTIEESSPVPPCVLMRFSGIASPEAAKTLNGAQLIASREQAAPLKDGEFYVEDLKGLPVTAVVTTEQDPSFPAPHSPSPTPQTIGHITDIIEGGNGELAEIQLINGEKKFVPFRKEFFPTISPAEGRVILQNLWVLE